ncbi:MAG: hypothetical protein JST86_11240 [Bacteroidetes bacterium]|nr:hypothetical protein [Bacteroidota bacterium]
MSELFGRVILERKGEWRNRMRGYKVVINGSQQEKKIMNGTSEEYEVPSGSNTIVCKVDWCGSNVYTFDIKAGETVYLKVKSGMKYFWVAYICLILMIVVTRFLKNEMPFWVQASAIAMGIAVLCYFLYFITFGRNSYLHVGKDEKNIFA